MTTVAGREPADRPDAEHRSSVARAALLAGGGFATTVATVLGGVAYGAVADPIALAALAAVLLIAGLTMFTAAYIATVRR